jgi:pimeloyl-ACP methyl ester carboxylesterase
MPFTTILNPRRQLIFSLVLLLLSPYALLAQGGDCPYPIIFLHGWTGDQTSWGDAYSNGSFESIYGELTDDHIFHAVLNAQTNTYIWGNDGFRGTNDDDVLVAFNNEDNELAPGCVYAINFDNSWNEDINNPIISRNDGSAIGFTESDSNESAIFKQGYALGEMIKKVLAANPDKSKVILAGHSMGGLAIREYLQRTGSGGHPWWATPGSGHSVASVLTTVTPHRGSNTLGNITGVRDDDDPPQRDGLPDLFSEAVRDLRYSWSCSVFGGDCTGAYLFGGPEDGGWGWWNEDVDCDGDESSNIEGINISGQAQGTGDPWNGTYDNPNLPLPTDIHYTWMTSDITGFSGDGVVAWDRQWLFNGNVPYPSDGVSGRLTDTLLNNANHLGANDDMNKLIRGMDEGDYPYFAWALNLENPYIVIPTYRARNTPHGNTTVDPDWFVFSVPSGFTDDLAIDVNPSSGVATQVGYFRRAIACFVYRPFTGSVVPAEPENGAARTIGDAV